MLRVEVRENWSGPANDAYLANNPNSLIYGSSRFLALVGSHLNASWGHLVAFRNDEVAGVLPFMIGEGKFGSVLNSLAYYGSNGAVIQASADEEAKLALLNAFYDHGSRLGCVSATVITNPLERDAAFYDRHAIDVLRDERIGQITHFPASQSGDDLLAMFDEPRPRNIRRAIKAGVRVECRKDKAALDFLYATHRDNMAAIGGLAKRESFFESIPGLMNDSDWAVYIATVDGVPVAGLLLFYFNKTVEYFTPVVVEAWRSTQALSLAIFTAMSDAMQAGYRNWNWGGTWLTQGGVYDFKKRWGTTDLPYFYYTRVIDPGILKRSRQDLSNGYNGFFVVPYSALEE